MKTHLLLTTFCFCLVSLVSVFSQAETKYPHVMPPDPLPPHPRLFVDQEEVEQLQKWSDEESWLGAYINLRPPTNIKMLIDIDPQNTFT